MIMTGSNDVHRGKLRELDREDARKRPGGVNNDMESLGLS